MERAEAMFGQQIGIRVSNCIYIEFLLKQTHLIDHGALSVTTTFKWPKFAFMCFSVSARFL